jgi:hypothetical protein
MQCQLVVMLILTSSTQVRGDDRARPEPQLARQLTGIHIQIAGKTRELTLEMPAQAAQAGDDEDPPPAQPVMPLHIRMLVLDRDNFDRWLFAHEQSERARQEHLNELLDAKIDLTAKAHTLTPSQRAKLRLAGRGDIKRFFDHVQTRRDAFEIDRKDFNTGLAALRRLDELSPAYRDGPFGVGSLFAKMLQKINNDRKAVH